MRIFFNKCCHLVGNIIQYGCVAHCTFTYVGDFVICQGPSMEPTISSNDIILTEHITPTINQVERGDIVIVKCPTNPHQNICKRVVALPGDKIRTGLTSKIVPIGHVWLEGDNKGNSSDSRSYGPVPLGLVKSRAVMKLWPLNDITLLSD